jgi:SPP1 gp7 family putative phage head morphogenesis protein
MCADLAAIAAGADATEALLRRRGIVVVKALDLSTSAGFDAAVMQLAVRLQRRAGAPEAQAVRAAVAELDIDWRRTTPEQRRRLVSSAMAAAGRHLALIPREVRLPLGDAAEEVVAATRSHGRRQGLAIGARFSAMDRRVIQHIVDSAANFIRDESGHRVDTFGERARQVVADGLASGLGRADLAAALEKVARDALIQRSPFYWETAAASFVGRGRSYAQMSSYAEAGIERYQIVAVLDEVTTPVCRWLNGKTFSVRSALDRFAEVEATDDPEAVKRLTPWVRERVADGRRRLYVEHATGRHELAIIENAATGRRDDAGSFRALRRDDQLADLGVGFPPYHGLCRTSTIGIA